MGAVSLRQARIKYMFKEEVVLLDRDHKRDTASDTMHKQSTGPETAIQSESIWICKPEGLASTVTAILRQERLSLFAVKVVDAELKKGGCVLQSGFAEQPLPLDINLVPSGRDAAESSFAICKGSAFEPSLTSTKRCDRLDRHL